MKSLLCCAFWLIEGRKNYKKKIWVREIFARREKKSVTFNNLVAE